MRLNHVRLVFSFVCATALVSPAAAHAGDALIRSRLENVRHMDPGGVRVQSSGGDVRRTFGYARSNYGSQARRAVSRPGARAQHGMRGEQVSHQPVATAHGSTDRPGVTEVALVDGSRGMLAYQHTRDNRPAAPGARMTRTERVRRTLRLTGVTFPRMLLTEARYVTPSIVPATGLRTTTLANAHGRLGDARVAIVRDHLGGQHEVELTSAQRAELASLAGNPTAQMARLESFFAAVR